MLKEITGNCFLIPGSGYSSNSYLFQGKKLALIDPGLKNNEPNLEESLQQAGLSPEDIELVLLTHGHSDHFSASSLFKKAELRLSQTDAELLNQEDWEFTCASYFPHGTAHFPKVENFLEEEEIIDLGDFKLKVIFTPGHTKGSVCFWEQEKGLLFSGDTLFSGACGRTDLKTSSKKDLIDSLHKLAKIEFETLCPGHGLILKGHQRTNIVNCLALLE
jgi:glyoxylase-like metal-dependent hydrolase (beta-lactamase superfamily II)